MAAYATGADSSSFPHHIPIPSETPGAWKEEDEDVPTPAAEAPKPEHNSHEPPPKRRRTHWPPRQCRICLEVVQPTFHYDDDSFAANLPEAMRPAPRVTYESEDGGRLMSPCKCKGSQRYVHEECLNAWRMADPSQKRNYWQCPTCRYKYKLRRLTWSAWISSTTAQIGLTIFILFMTVFILGFIADPIINMYFDPLNTITHAGRVEPIHLDDEPTWIEHMAKGVASLGLVGFAKFLFTLSPIQWFQYRSGAGYRSNVGGSGRDRLQQISWITLAIGIATVIWGIWKLVRAWARRTLVTAGERVMDVPGSAEDDDEDES